MACLQTTVAWQLHNGFELASKPFSAVAIVNDILSEPGNVFGTSKLGNRTAGALSSISLVQFSSAQHHALHT